ncbi:MAG: DUF4139 domain-containing protein [Acidobacteriota bacterium]|nr:DUF4139 domain-containing protein [Acidobacteriota bacterium]MDH3785532.1 DUF4139 domain-containing protein [Acidobacteriota bacterium]
MFPGKWKKHLLGTLIVTLAPSLPLIAGIKLITLPPRDRVEIQLDHGQVTLVEEERRVPLTAGLNEVVFAWANTSIDRSSIQLRPLEAPGDVEVISVSYPPGQSELVWQVAARSAGPARVRISYLIGRLDKTFAYRAEASEDESTLSLRQYVLLHNAANEEFGIAGMWPGFGARIERPIGVNETRKILTSRFEGVPIRKTYTADFARHGYQDSATKQLTIPMHYVLVNDDANGLGEFPLQFGKARIFQLDGHGGAAFLGEDWAAFTPRDDELKLFLGVTRDIVVKRTIDRRDEIRRDGNLRDYDVVVKYEIENFKDSQATLDIVESMNALRQEILGHSGRDVEWEIVGKKSLNSLIDDSRTTAESVVAQVTVPPASGDQGEGKKSFAFQLRIKNEW